MGQRILTLRNRQTGEFAYAREGDAIDEQLFELMLPVRVRATKQPALVPARSFSRIEHEQILAVRGKHSRDLAAIYEDDFDEAKHELDWPRGEDAPHAPSVAELADAVREEE